MAYREPAEQAPVHRSGQLIVFARARRDTWAPDMPETQWAVASDHIADVHAPPTWGREGKYEQTRDWVIVQTKSGEHWTAGCSVADVIAAMGVP